MSCAGAGDGGAVTVDGTGGGGGAVIGSGSSGVGSGRGTFFVTGSGGFGGAFGGRRRRPQELDLHRLFLRRIHAYRIGPPVRHLRHENRRVQHERRRERSRDDPALRGVALQPALGLIEFATPALGFREGCHYFNCLSPYICSSVLVGMTRFCTPTWRNSSKTSVMA